MEEKIICGKVTNNIKIFSSNYLEDKELLIALDGINIDKILFNKIKRLYIKHKEEFVKKIDDYYSIYLFDKKDKKLILIRDRMGLKNIYYCNDKNNLFFGNDIIKLVNQYHLKKEINTKSLSMYFRFHYITPPETIFNNINKLEHGTYIVYEKNKIEKNIYWCEIDKYNSTNNRIYHKDDIINEMNKRLIKSIKKFLSIEKEYGVYLSGGIDSSLVAALCSKFSKQKINTFSIGFQEKETNEAEKSKRIAEYLKTNHHELYIDEEKAIKLVKKIPKYYTEPFGDISALPTIALNEFAKDNNIKIAITGDGADQLFCGSNVYDTIWRSQLAHKLLNPLNINIKKQYIKNRRLMYIYSNSDKRYQAQCEILALDKNLIGLFADDGKKRFETEEKIKTKNWQERRMILDLGTFISDRINNKVNVAAIKNNIEIRSPFQNYAFIEYSFLIPHKYKYYKRNKKYILKELLYKYIPKEFFETKKRGFAIPTKKWLKTYFYKDLKRFCNKKYIEEQKIFNYKAINDILKKIDDDEVKNILWDYLIFQLWYEEYMK